MRDHETVASPESGRIEKRHLIAHLTSVHPPFDVRIFEKECRSLARAGWLVTLVCCHSRSEVVGGVTLSAIPHSSPNRFLRMAFTTARIYRTALGSGAEIFHFHDPELIPAGLLLKMRGARVIYDVHEDVPLQIRQKTWIPSLLRGPVAAFASILETLAGRKCDAIVAATPEIGRRFPASKTIVVQNYPILGELDEPEGRPYRQRPMSAVYIGSLSLERGAAQMIEAARRLEQSNGGHVHFAGPWAPPSLQGRFINPSSAQSVTYHGILDREGVRDLLASARAGLVLLQPSPRYLDAHPVKLFEYWAAGLPVVASDFPLWRSIVDGVGGGLLVDPTDPEAIASAIAWLFTHPDEAEAMGQRGKLAVKNRLNWSCEEGKLLELYARIGAF